jgi:alpha-L-fucosidase
MCDGDYGTPEGVIGGMNIANDWESCIHVGQGWSYRGEDGFKGPDDCIKMLVSCTTGGGNLLLNFGPRPDGTFADGEVKVATAMGEWLKKYGESIYGTRGGPYRNGSWGGTCHKGNKMYVHVYDWPREGLALDPLSNKVLAARTLTGGHVTVKQSKDELLLEVASEDRDTPVTVIELTLENTIPTGTLIGGIHTPKDYVSELGELLSENAKLEISSTCAWNNPAEYSKLFTGDKVGYAFHTDKEKNPWAKIDIGAVKMVNAVVIDNRPEDRRSEGLILSVSEDGNKWEEVWKAKEWTASWVVPLTRVFAGATVPGRKVRYIRLETKNDSPRELMLQRVAVFGVK